MRSWPLHERKRALCFITCSERKISSRRALCIRQSEKRFKALGHIKMDLLKKMVLIQGIGGLVDQDCTAFLSDRSEDDQVELGINSQRHLAIVVPLTALKTRDITDLTDRKFLSIAQSVYKWLFIYHFVCLFVQKQYSNNFTKNHKIMI